MKAHRKAGMKAQVKAQEEFVKKSINNVSIIILLNCTIRSKKLYIWWLKKVLYLGNSKYIWKFKWKSSGSLNEILSESAYKGLCVSSSESSNQNYLKTVKWPYAYIHKYCWTALF